MPLTCADETSMDVEGRRKTVISALESRQLTIFNGGGYSCLVTAAAWRGMPGS